MQTTTLVIIILIASVVSGILGYLITLIKFNKTNSVLQNQLDTLMRDLPIKTQSLDALQIAHEEQTKLHHALALAHGKLEEKNTAQSEKILDQERDFKDRVNEITSELSTARVQLEQSQSNLATIGKQARGAEEKAEQIEVKYKDVLTQRDMLQTKLDTRIDQYNTLSAEHTELKTTLDQRNKHFQQQLEQFTETKQSLTKEFENLANKIFEEKGKTFTDTSKSSIDVLLQPFREQIEGFQKRVNEVHESSIRGNSSLNAEIQKVLDIGLKMSSEANNLTSALKGDSQQRGAWGEAQLRRTLEMSGLVEETHFEVQSTFKDAEGKQKQTDYLIKLPDNKHIIIDSKVSLVAYDRAISAESPEAYQLAMADHIKAVRKHIDDLASKDYTNVLGMRSPSFVLMFMPIEPAYIEALKSNKDLFEYGYKKSVVLVSHTTLIPILRTVSNLWMMERSNAEAREISEKAGDIYNQVCVVAERLSKLGNTLSTVSNHYNSTVKALAGQQGLYGKVERFNQLSTKVSKSLPHLEPIQRDYETERLSLIVEAIEDTEIPEMLPEISNNEHIITETNLEEENY